MYTKLLKEFLDLNENAVVFDVLRLKINDDVTEEEAEEFVIVACALAKKWIPHWKQSDAFKTFVKKIKDLKNV